MQIHTLKLNNPKRRRKTIGRGGRKGTYSGRGNKGQKARTGAHIDPLFEGGRSTLIDHMKKKRGFKSLMEKAVIVDLAKIAKKFKNGATVDRESLIKAGLVGKIKPATRIKILGTAPAGKKFGLGKGIIASAAAKKSLQAEEKKPQGTK